MTTTQNTDYEQVAAGADFGQPATRKTGRNPAWPYVPVLVMSNGSQKQILGVAYATRTEALAAAERHVTQSRSLLATKLADPKYRALRAQFGLGDQDEVLA